MGTLIALELRTRARSTGWIVLQILWVLAIGGLTAGVYFTATNSGEPVGKWLYSIILYFTLFLATIVTPAIGGGSINGDRASGLLTQVQTTAASASTIVWAKAFAAWIASLGFVLTAAPFLAFAAWAGGVDWPVVLVSVVVLIAELAFFAALSVAFSGLFSRSVFSVALSYLVIALLSVGTVLGFGIGSSLLTSTREVQVSTYDESASELGQANCTTVTEQRTYQRADLLWPVLAANPFVIVADATPARFTTAAGGATPGYPDNLLTGVKVALRTAQASPIPTETVNECTWNNDTLTPREQLAGTQPVWFYGLAAQFVFALVLLGWATARTRLPYRSLKKGTRIV